MMEVWNSFVWWWQNATLEVLLQWFFGIGFLVCLLIIILGDKWPHDPN